MIQGLSVACLHSPHGEKPSERDSKTPGLPVVPGFLGDDLRKTVKGLGARGVESHPSAELNQSRRSRSRAAAGEGPG